MSPARKSHFSFRKFARSRLKNFKPHFAIYSIYGGQTTYDGHIWCHVILVFLDLVSRKGDERTDGQNLFLPVGYNGNTSHLR